MKKTFLLSLMSIGLAGLTFAAPGTDSHKKDVNTNATTTSIVNKKNQKAAWMPWPEAGNPHRPCKNLAWMPWPEAGNPHRPCKDLAWMPWPEAGNPHRPCKDLAWMPWPEAGNPHRPC